MADSMANELRMLELRRAMQQREREGDGNDIPRRRPDVS